MKDLQERFRRLLVISAEKRGETRVESMEGAAGRVVTARLRPGTDLVTGIEEVVRRHLIAAGAVTVSFGSLAGAEVSWKEGSRPDPRGKTERFRIEGPVSFLSSQGKVGLTESGDPVVHLHGVLVDWEGRMWGGHFHRDNNPVFSTFELVIHEITGVRHTKSGTKSPGRSC